MNLLLQLRICCRKAVTLLSLLLRLSHIAKMSPVKAVGLHNIYVLQHVQFYDQQFHGETGRTELQMGKYFEPVDVVQSVQ